MPLPSIFRRSAPIVGVSLFVPPSGPTFVTAVSLQLPFMWEATENFDACSTGVAYLLRASLRPCSSVYHRDAVNAQGAEPTKTYFHTRNLRFGHHIDYAFLSDDIPADLRVGGSEDWLGHSDHRPLILDIP
jgi:hypothetical protein